MDKRKEKQLTAVVVAGLAVVAFVFVGLIFSQWKTADMPTEELVEASFEDEEETISVPDIVDINKDVEETDKAGDETLDIIVPDIEPEKEEETQHVVEETNGGKDVTVTVVVPMPEKPEPPKVDMPEEPPTPIGDLNGEEPPTYNEEDLVIDDLDPIVIEPEEALPDEPIVEGNLAPPSENPFSNPDDMGTVEVIIPSKTYGEPGTGTKF